MKQRGRIDSVTAAVGEAAGALRRRRVGRQPYVKLHDGHGGVELLDSDSELGGALIEVAAAMVDAVDAGGSRDPDPGGSEPPMGGKARK